MEKQGALAEHVCAESGVSFLPYGNAWWLLGRSINRVVGELTRLSHSDHRRYQLIER